MLFRRLIESQRAAAAHSAAVQGLLLSAAAHALLVATSLALTRDPGSGETQQVRESLIPVEYLIPPDRLAAMRPRAERVDWIDLGTAVGYGYRGAETSSGDRMPLRVVRGDSTDLDATTEDYTDQPPIALGDSIMTELQVDSAVVRYEDSAAPPYPETMLRRRIEGLVLVQYVVDSTGRADTSTFRVLSATHPDFVKAVKTTLPKMRFRPAMMNGKRVAQLVQQPFAFKIVDTAAVVRGTKPPL
jgi:TonB family protein